MTKSKHTEAQIIAALKQLEAGRTVEDVAREHGVSKHTNAGAVIGIKYARQRLGSQGFGEGTDEVAAAELLEGEVIGAGGNP